MGQVLEAAKVLAREITKFPQICIRVDRKHSYEHWDLGLSEALAGAACFAAGKSRSGDFKEM
uniref:Uncharacterized protein n=1 Tax=uncultured alpha proteobacterium EF100_102A06 TaxID=710799 RepID=E0Y267_9PROT|nr:hypothetical protein [uncultured alpha proteobacterium EF100_102A06]